MSDAYRPVPRYEDPYEAAMRALVDFEYIRTWAALWLFQWEAVAYERTRASYLATMQREHSGVPAEELN